MHGRYTANSRLANSPLIRTAAEFPAKITDISRTATNFILDPSAYGFGNARVSSRKLCAGVAKIWLFGPHSACSLIQPSSTKTFCFFYIYFIAKVLCCFGIRTEEIQLTALKNFQVSKAIVVAAEKIPLNVPNHIFETWSLHMLDSWLNTSVDYFTGR